jgi:hypothetical protein
VSGRKHRVAQYGQWDGYPQGQGKTVLAFCKRHLSTKKGRQEFQAKLGNVRWITDQALKDLWKAEGADDSDMVSMQIADQFGRKHPQLSRDCGAEVLSIVRRSRGTLLLRDSIDFAGDSLFCEWAYVIDLDKGVLEIYEGFQDKPIGRRERFARYFKRQEHRKESQYWPIKLAKSYSLSRLPTARRFYADLQQDEEEEAA